MFQRLFRRNTNLTSPATVALTLNLLASTTYRRCEIISFFSTTSTIFFTQIYFLDFFVSQRKIPIRGTLSPLPLEILVNCGLVNISLNMIGTTLQHKKVNFFIKLTSFQGNKNKKTSIWNKIHILLLLPSEHKRIGEQRRIKL